MPWPGSPRIRKVADCVLFSDASGLGEPRLSSSMTGEDSTTNRSRRCGCWQRAIRSVEAQAKRRQTPGGDSLRRSSCGICATRWPSCWARPFRNRSSAWVRLRLGAGSELSAVEPCFRLASPLVAYSLSAIRGAWESGGNLRQRAVNVSRAAENCWPSRRISWPAAESPSSAYMCERLS